MTAGKYKNATSMSFAFPPIDIVIGGKYLRVANSASQARLGTYNYVRISNSNEVGELIRFILDTATVYNNKIKFLWLTFAVFDCGV